MAADVSAKEADVSAKKPPPIPANPCCKVWKEKFSDMIGKRNTLRQALKDIVPQIDKIQADNLQLKKACEEERARAETEKDGKEKETAARISLENEISALKSEICSLQKKGGSDCEDRNEEVKLLQVCVSEGEKEISRLKELLEKEKIRAELEKKNAEVDKKTGENDISRLKELLEKEKIKAESGKNADVENEISRLKELLEKEKIRAESEKKNAEVDKKAGENEISRLKELLEKEKIRAESGKKNAEVDKKTGEKEIKKLKELLQKQKIRAESEKKNAEVDKKAGENEISRLKELLEKEKIRAESGKKNDEVENEISRLKELLEKEKIRAESEKKNAEVDKKTGEKEIKKLKKLLEKEKTMADLEKKNSAAEKKRATEAWKYVKTETSKAEEYRLQLDALKKEADEAKSELVSETSKFEGVNKKLEEEKQKLRKERKRADLEMSKAGEQRKLAEANRKNAAEERSRAEALSQQLEEAKRKIEELKKEIHELFSRNMDESKLVLEFLKSEEANKKFEVEKQKAISEKRRADAEMVKAEEQRKLAEVCRKKATEEKYRADQLSQQLAEDKRKIKELQKQINELLSSKNQAGPPSLSPDKDTNAETLNVKLLKKQLKLEKMQVKHVKQVAKLEKSRNSMLQQELGHLKLEFVQFINRLDVLHKCFSTSAEGIDDPEKAGDLVNLQMLKLKQNLYGLEPFRENGFLKPSCMTKAASDPLGQTLQQSAPLLPISEGNCAESMSGIDSKLESLLGGSNRKTLQSSAINFSTTSFSDGQLVGSQERGAFSVITSAKLVEEDLNVQPTISGMSGEVTKMRCNENLAVVAENSVRSPLSADVVGVIGHGRKRKRMIDAIESIGSLHSKGKKLHLQIEEKLSVLHDMLNRHRDKPLEEAKFVVPNQHGDLYAKNDRLKKIKTFQEEKVVLQHLCDSDEPKKAEKVETKVHEDANVFRQDFQPSNNITVTAQAWREALNDSVTSDLQTMECFNQITDGNYMKLLDLDNAVDEECYRKAMEMPLSPTLPEIEFQDVETFVFNNFEPLVEKSFCRHLSNEKGNLVPFCSFDVINLEIDSNNSNKSLLHKNEALIDSLDILGNNGKCQTQDSGAEVGMSNIPSSGDEGVKFPFDSELGSAPHSIPKYCIVFSDIKNNSSISRIFSATACMVRCLLGTQTEWILHKILLALKMEEKLLPREKVCVFFSLLLLNFSTADLERSRNFLNSNSIPCLDTFAEHISAVISDVEARSVFAELWLDGLFNLIEDFLVDGRVMVYTDESSQMLIEYEPRVNIFLDGLNIRLSSQAASADQLVAGSIILASICTAIDHIDFICEASYNIFRMCRHDSSVMLTILHVFAYLGGERYFTLKKHNLTMTVLKSIITFLERGSLSAAAASCVLSASGAQTEFHPCAKCPFSEDATPIDIVVSLLLEKLQNYAQTGTMNHKDNAERSLSHEEVHCVLDMNCDALCCLNKCRMPVTHSAVNVTLCHLSDVLSVVELLACKMGWEWTCSKIVPQLLKILESSPLGNFAIAVVILLGQLGRLGLDAVGYEDKGVESLRSDLSAFLWRDTTIRAGLPIQIATVTALLGLLSLDFEGVIQSNVKLPANASESVRNVIRKWFSLLSKEQQALSFSLLQSTGVITS